jgi:hypothetical protein
LDFGARRCLEIEYRQRVFRIFDNPHAVAHDAGEAARLNVLRQTVLPQKGSYATR